jgi:hypothetical protein
MGEPKDKPRDFFPSPTLVKRARCVADAGPGELDRLALASRLDMQTIRRVIAGERVKSSTLISLGIGLDEISPMTDEDIAEIASRQPITVDEPST